MKEKKGFSKLMIVRHIIEILGSCFRSNLKNFYLSAVVCLKVSQVLGIGLNSYNL